MLPHTALTKDFVSDGWTEQEHEQWKDKLGNLVWLPSLTSKNVAKLDYLGKQQVYEQCGTEILAFEELPGLAWTPEVCKKRDREVLLAVAQRSNLSEDLMERTAAKMTVCGSEIKGRPAAEGVHSVTPRWPPKSAAGPSSSNAVMNAVAAPAAVGRPAPAVVTLPASAAAAAAEPSDSHRSQTAADAAGPSNPQQTKPRKKARANGLA